MVLIVRFLSDGWWGWRRGRRDLTLGCNARGRDAAASLLRCSSSSSARSTATGRAPAGAQWPFHTVLVKDGLGTVCIWLVDPLVTGHRRAADILVKLDLRQAICIPRLGCVEACSTDSGIVDDASNVVPLLECWRISSTGKLGSWCRSFSWRWDRGAYRASTRDDLRRRGYRTALEAHCREAKFFLCHLGFQRVDGGVQQN